MPSRASLQSLTILGGLLALSALLPAGCTFYTGPPGASTASPPGGAGSTSSNGGADGTQGGDGQGSAASDAGAAGEGNPGPVWVDATGSLTGRSNASGDVVFLSTKPDEDLLIAGLVGYGLWASSDGGKTWRGLGLSGASDPIINGPTAIIYDPDHKKTFWEAGIYGPGVFRTDDDGLTINQLGSATHNNLIGIDFTDPKRQTILAGPHEQMQALNLSHDGGANWTPIGKNLPAGSGYSSFPVVIDAQTFVVGCSNMIARSTDAGASWTKVSTVGGAGNPLVTSKGDIYWGSAPETGLMKSTDQGQTWTRAVGANIIRSMVVLELPDGRLASLNEHYLLVSPDGGDSWAVASAPLPFVPDGLVYSAQEKAFFIWITEPDLKIPAKSIMRYDWDFETQ